jgi:16S rRNA A1518/A1519 N6-dimethyltransferase RsmA/KsgA/DIM1 with predicted DNA glycosylase/AP lyase activity
LGRRVVEVGCGLGNFTGMLLDREAVIAVDSNPDCIQRFAARQK